MNPETYADPEIHALAKELVDAQAAVKQELKEAGERGILMFNYQAKDWPRCLAAQKAWFELAACLAQP